MKPETGSREQDEMFLLWLRLIDREQWSSASIGRHFGVRDSYVRNVIQRIRDHDTAAHYGATA